MYFEEFCVSNIELTANPEEVVRDFRINRLHRILGYVQAVSDNLKRPDTLKKIARLHDHNGTLTVYWKEGYELQEEFMFEKAWESIIGEGSTNIFHEVLKGV